ALCRTEIAGPRVVARQANLGEVKAIEVRNDSVTLAELLHATHKPLRKLGPVQLLRRTTVFRLDLATTRGPQGARPAIDVFRIYRGNSPAARDITAPLWPPRRRASHPIMLRAFGGPSRTMSHPARSPWSEN